MQFYYGQQMPLRILDEAEFWKRQEEEHTVVIRELVDNLEEKYVQALQDWEKVLGETRQQVLQYIQTVIRAGHYVPQALQQQVLQFVPFWLKQSLGFIELCRQIQNHSEAVKGNMTAKVVLDHIIRESEYFIGIAQALLYNL
ncbi:DUF2935 domain-containing protein [Calidifontibacillus erzurumensis]|uniref:DUF2935 domain-containing protein n=1 Tax=Calidifontibacillus erzurumensis TaxID=2741433 RepID=A0A8J8K9G4_9BACI|nr:DUF2935 domain-containing protein [Calidifontibacillus erzurumensis]NSL53136.1 DUF2935 domain-containing protein [Calidifontibacillus erzurumensis]